MIEPLSNAKKLQKEYRRLKGALNETGQRRNKEVEWPYFELMDRILGRNHYQKYC